MRVVISMRAIESLLSIIMSPLRLWVDIMYRQSRIHRIVVIVNFENVQHVHVARAMLQMLDPI